MGLIHALTAIVTHIYIYKYTLKRGKHTTTTHNGYMHSHEQSHIKDTRDTKRKKAYIHRHIYFHKIHKIQRWINRETDVGKCT